MSYGRRSRFFKKLPGMSEQEYAGLVMAGMAHGGHHH
jgi:hypothetical protein